MNMTHDKLRLIVNSADSEQVELILHGVVGDADNYCDSKSLNLELAKYPNADVTLRVNSVGGSFFDGLSIYNALRRHAGPTQAVVESLAASAATICALGCSTVLMHKAAAWHVHEALTSVSGGHAAEFRDALVWLEKANELVTDLYCLRTGKTPAEIRRVILGNGDGTVFTAAEAEKYGFVDAVISRSSPPKPRPFKAGSDKAKWLQQARRRLAALDRDPVRESRLRHVSERLAAIGR